MPETEADLLKKLEQLDALCIERDRRELIQLCSQSYRIKLLKGRTVEKVYGKLVLIEKWRIQWESDLESVDLHEVQKLIESGELFSKGFDLEGRPILWVRGCLYNNSVAPELYLRYYQYCFDSMIRNMPSGVDEFVMAIDCTDIKTFNVSVTFIRGFAKILEEAYPERLGRALILGPNLIFKMFFNFLSPLLHASTRQKVLLIKDKYDIHQYIEDKRDVPQFLRSNGTGYSFELPENMLIHDEVRSASRVQLRRNESVSVQALRISF
mmetsp:Transcript_10325/g.18601  ORF Transcript_10325/g.18601 Transcript_10325/m.18601 type:complete len:267 (+) Transcript_10325:60-860(+)